MPYIGRIESQAMLTNLSLDSVDVTGRGSRIGILAGLNIGTRIIYENCIDPIMEYSVKHDDSLGITTVYVSGDHHRPDDSRTLQLLTKDIHAKTGSTRILFDMRDVNITGGFSDIYSTAIETAKINLSKSINLAMVYSGELEDHEFLGKLVSARGYTIRIYEDYDEAVAWLSSLP